MVNKPLFSWHSPGIKPDGVICKQRMVNPWKGRHSHHSCFAQNVQVCQYFKHIFWVYIPTCNTVRYSSIQNLYLFPFPSNAPHQCQAHFPVPFPTEQSQRGADYQERLCTLHPGDFDSPNGIKPSGSWSDLRADCAAHSRMDLDLLGSLPA